LKHKLNLSTIGDTPLEASVKMLGKRSREVAEPLATEGLDAEFAAWQAKVAGTNISETTLLATDYLNHFNEITMLLEMVPDMPDMLEECRMWEPKTYQQHFADSGFSDKELAIEAYDHVPLMYKEPFEETIGHMNALVAKSLDQLDNHMASGDMELVKVVVHSVVAGLHRLGEVAGSIIHGSAATMSQDEIDDLTFTPDEALDWGMEPAAASPASSAGGMTQEEIDALGF
jgi:hypothetical protein